MNAARKYAFVFLAVLFFVLAVPARSAETNKNSITPPARREVPGRHEKLKYAELFVPDFFHVAANGAADVVIFFHGASWCAEQNFYDAHKNGVIVTVNTTNVEQQFRDPATLPELLAETVTALKPDGVRDVRRICLASFSGGFVGVRAILRQPELAARITDVVLADSLYGPKVAGTTDELEPGPMAPFLKFARRAAEGETHFLFSQLYPPEPKYRDNTTTLAAFYLTDHLSAPRVAATGQNSAGATLLYRADKGNFHVLGYSGMSNQDHFNHFYGISDLFRETSLDDAPLDPSKLKFATLTWPEVKAMVASNSIVLVDARPKELYQAGRIPGAVPLPLPDINANIATFESSYPRNMPLVIYCSSPDCEQAHWEAEALVGVHHYNNVRLMPGGYEEYLRAVAAEQKQ